MQNITPHQLLPPLHLYKRTLHNIRSSIISARGSKRQWHLTTQLKSVMEKYNQMRRCTVPALPRTKKTKTTTNSARHVRSHPQRGRKFNTRALSPQEYPSPVISLFVLCTSVFFVSTVLQVTQYRVVRAQPPIPPNQVSWQRPPR